MLADPNDDVLVLADGTRIEKATGKTIKEKKTSSMIEIPSPRTAQEIVAKTRRGIADMPVQPQQMNAISLCVFYTMWGLTPQDIAIQLNITVQQVNTIKKLPEFLKLYDDIFKGVMETEANDVRGFFQQKARTAAAKIVELMDEEGALGFAASKDVLDRAGHRPADVVEHRHRLDNSLQIEFIKKSDNANTIPVIDAEFEEVN
jgi:hypothetical protein